MYTRPALFGVTPPSRVVFDESSPKPNDFLPDKRKGNSLRTALVSTGYAVSVSGNLVLLFSPLIRKHAPAIVAKLAKTLGPESSIKLLAQRHLEKLSEVLPDKGKLEKRLWGILGAGFLLQMPMDYKTSLNSGQPSMLLCNLLTTLSTFCMLFSANVVFRVMTVIADVFNRAGKYNDINNSNHLANRREWRLKAYAPDSSAEKPLGQKLAGFFRYARKDLRQIFSFTPWKNLAAEYRKKDTWAIPNANLTALAGQLALFAGGITLLSTVKKLARFHRAFQGVAIGSIVLHDAMFQSPIVARAWQNRHETDGKLVLGSTPFFMLGSPFFLSKNLLFMNSFAGLANPFWAKGINLNSEHRLAAVNYIRKIHAKALRDPTLRASRVLDYFRQNPDACKLMKKRMGETGFLFVMQSLRLADTEMLKQGTPLAKSLYPITIANV